jgi:6-pyruvoyltetrahydropterin/6-carboxytetrahydropterin synthase
MIYVTRKEHFNAAHRLFNPAWSEEKNQEVLAHAPITTGTGIILS